MKIPEIKRLVENHSVDDLMAAEEALLNEEVPVIEIIGNDEGEQLTHVLAATYILNQMENHAMDFKTALRDYTVKVRSSID